MESLKKQPLSIEELNTAFLALVQKYDATVLLRFCNALTSPRPATIQQLESLTQWLPYLKMATMRVFELQDATWETSKHANCSEARGTCMYLMRLHTPLSAQQIGDVFKCSRRAVFYHTNRCKERLDIAHVYPLFAQRFKQLETILLTYLMHI